MATPSHRSRPAAAVAAFGIAACIAISRLPDRAAAPTAARQRAADGNFAPRGVHPCRME